MTQLQTIPGLTDQTTTAALLSDLRALPQKALEFYLHGEQLVSFSGNVNMASRTAHT